MAKGLLGKADRIFSQYIRRKYIINDGAVRCVTCDKIDHWKSLHAGHFIGRQHKSTRFDETNVHPQCVSCNSFREGEKDVYALFLVRTYGQDVLEELNRKKNTIVQMGDFELQQVVDVYTQKLKDLS